MNFLPCVQYVNMHRNEIPTHMFVLFLVVLFWRPACFVCQEISGFLFFLLVACKFCAIKTKADEGSIFGVYECVLSTQKFGFVYKDAHTLIVKRGQYKIQMHYLSNKEWIWSVCLCVSLGLCKALFLRLDFISICLSLLVCSFEGRSQNIKHSLEKYSTQAEQKKLRCRFI